ncbi:MAG TPA: tetratricopeptide repeat protein, partial [Polyangiaceae bacterium]
MLRCPRLLLLLFIGFSPLTYVRPVRAEPTSSDQERARRHYDAARSYYDVGKYEDAAREFRSAYELSGRPHLLKNVATALERAGSFAESAQALEEYLRLQPDAEDRRSVEIHIKQLQERAKKQESSAEAQTQGGTSQKANKPPAEPVNPPAAQGAASAEPDKHEKSQLPAWLLIGAGGALGAGALVTGLMSHSKFQDLESKCTNNVCPSDLRSERD